MRGWCCGSREPAVAPIGPMNLMLFKARSRATRKDPEEHNSGSSPSKLSNPGAAVMRVELDREVLTITCETDTKSETNSLTTLEGSPNFLFSIKFDKKPLGIILTSNNEGTCAYVTEIIESKNKDLENNKLPLKSKLLKLNDVYLEYDKFDDIIDAVIDASFPKVLTFCHPDGLFTYECPDHTLT